MFAAVVGALFQMKQNEADRKRLIKVCDTHVEYNLNENKRKIL